MTAAARALMVKSVHRRRYEIRGMTPMADPRSHAEHRRFFHPVRLEVAIRNDHLITATVFAVWPPVPEDSPALEVDPVGRPVQLCRFTNFDQKSVRLKEAPMWILDLVSELITEWEEL